MARRKTPEPEPEKPKRLRQPRTRIDDMIGNYLTETRNSHKGEDDWELRPIAERMDTIDGEPHDMVAHWRELLKDEATLDPDVATSYVNSMSKAPLAVEGLGRGKAKPKGAVTVSQLESYSRATYTTINAVLEASGVVPPSLTIEDAIAADPRLNSQGKELLLNFLQGLLAGKSTTR